MSCAPGSKSAIYDFPIEACRPFMIAGYSVTSINMKNGDEFSDTDDTLRYFAGCPRCGWTGKVYFLPKSLCFFTLSSGPDWYHVVGNDVSRGHKFDGRRYQM